LCNESATNGHKSYAAIPSQKSDNSKNSINFFSHSPLQYTICDLISDYCYVTLLIHSHAETTISGATPSVFPIDLMFFHFI